MVVGWQVPPAPGDSHGPRLPTASRSPWFTSGAVRSLILLFPPSPALSRKGCCRLRTWPPLPGRTPHFIKSYSAGWNRVRCLPCPIPEGGLSRRFRRLLQVEPCHSGSGATFSKARSPPAGSDTPVRSGWGAALSTHGALPSALKLPSCGE